MTRARRRAGLLLAVFATFFAALAVNLWALRTPLRVDFTAHGVFSIGPQTREVLQRLEGPIRITFFYDLRNQLHLDALALLGRYAEASPWITVKSYDPDLQPGVARSMGIRFAGEAVFEGAGDPIVVRGGSEEDFTNGLLRASSGATREICFSEGHGESDPESRSSHDHFETEEDPGHDHSFGGEPRRVVERHGMGLAREALVTMGYRVSKRASGGRPDAFEGCAVVVVASPTVAFEAHEVESLRGFLAAGGSAMLLLEPNFETGLAPVLEAFGVHPSGRSVYDPERHYWTDPATPAVSRYPRHRITRGLALSFLPGVAALEPALGGVPETVVATPLLETSDRAYFADTPTEAAVHTLMVYAVRTEHRGEPRELSSRLAAVGDGDFATNSFFPVLGNGELFLNTIHALAEVERLIGIAPRSYAPARVELTGEQMRRTFMISALLLPGLALLAGGWVWRRRRA